MKKYLYQFLIVTLLVLANSCSVEEEKYVDRTVQGRAVYQRVLNHTDDIIELVEMVSVVNHYQTSSNDNKEGIRQFYLPRYEISENHDGSRIFLENKDVKIVVRNNHRPLTSVGARWTIQASRNNDKLENEADSIIKSGEFVLMSNGGLDWNVRLDGLGNGVMSLLEGYYYHNISEQLSLSTISGAIDIDANKAADRAPNLYNYTLKTGLVLASGKLPLRYEFRAPTIYKSLSSYSLVLTEGVLGIDVQVAPELIDNIIVTINEYESLKVNINGVEEHWTQKYFNQDYWWY